MIFNVSNEGPPVEFSGKNVSKISDYFDCMYLEFWQHSAFYFTPIEENNNIESDSSCSMSNSPNFCGLA
jgi:hypothetical protein